MKLSIYKITINGIFVALFLLFTFVPWIGYFPIGIINITLMPLLFLISVEALYLSTKLNPIIGGLLYGLLFGISSLLQNLIYPNLTSFIFVNPLFSIVPRLLMGFFTGIIAFIGQKIPILLFRDILMAFCAVSLNTFFVLLFLHELGPVVFPDLTSQKTFKIFSWMILLTNYLPELVITMIIYPIIAKVLKIIL